MENTTTTADNITTELSNEYVCPYGCDIGMNKCREPSSANLPATTVIMLMFFFGGLGIFMLKIYNVLSSGKVYDKRMTFITFIIGLLAWFFVFSITTINAPLNAFGGGSSFDLLVLTFSTILLFLTGGFTVAELILQFSMDTLGAGQRFGAERMLGPNFRREP
jgi:hypothetical protein